MAARDSAYPQCPTFLPDPEQSMTPWKRAIEIPATQSVREPAMLILDSGGRIQFCSEASALHCKESDLIGCSIRELIPALPLRPNTPGYNIAFVQFQFANGIWQRHWIRLPNALSLLADIRMRAVVDARRSWLLAAIRSVRWSDWKEEHSGWNGAPVAPALPRGFGDLGLCARGAGQHSEADPVLPAPEESRTL